MNTFNTFERFCDAISTSVESKIISWHGNYNQITDIQALALLKHGYMLGGWIIVPSGNSVYPISLYYQMRYLPISPFYPYRNRIVGQGLVRDNQSLNNYYSRWKGKYHLSINESELKALFAIVEQNLLHYSMEIIDNTCEFGG